MSGGFLVLLVVMFGFMYFLLIRPQRTQQRKPRVPVRRTVTGRHPMLRLIGRNDLAAMQPWLDEWAATVGGWIGMGLEPFVFTHTPDDIHAAYFGVQARGALA